LSILITNHQANQSTKKGKKEDAINYQLITLVPALSKVLEKVIANQLIAFLENTIY
jgi:hypothetical protein